MHKNCSCINTAKHKLSGHIALRNGPQEHIRDVEADQAGVGWTTSHSLDATRTGNIEVE